MSLLESSVLNYSTGSVNFVCLSLMHHMFTRTPATYSHIKRLHLEPTLKLFASDFSVFMGCYDTDLGKC